MLLKNKTIERLASEERITHMSSLEGYEIYVATHKRMTAYKRLFLKRNYYSHINAENLIFNA